MFTRNGCPLSSPLIASCLACVFFELCYYTNLLQINKILLDIILPKNLEMLQNELPYYFSFTPYGSIFISLHYNPEPIRFRYRTHLFVKVGLPRPRDN